MNARIVSGSAFCQLCRAVHREIGQEQRYAHSVRVARTAEQLAARHGLNTRHARTAGLLHDVARLWPKAALLAGCAERGIAVGEFEREFPVVLHAPIGAALARERFGVDEQPILQAIERHTIGALSMSPLDAVVFIADALEPGRDFAERRDLLETAFRDLDAGLYAVYYQTKAYLAQRGLRLGPVLETVLADHERKSS